eukprot:gene8703-10300_t
MSSENIIVHKKKKPSAVWFDFNKLYFPSQPKESFRVRASTGADGVTLWVESVKTKQQWQVTVKKVGDCGPSGIPDDVVYTLLEKALGVVESGNRAPDDPEIDLSNTDKGVLLTLQLVLGGVWRPEFVFTLLPVALEKVDLLEARLRDAHDEIETLRAGSAASYLSISSKTDCAYNQIVQWNGDGPLMSASHYKLSEDFRQVSILKSGVYQVSVRLGGGNNGSGHFTSLQLNGADIATCFQSDGNYHTNTAQINEVLKLSANDVLQIKCGFNNGSNAMQSGNRFTMLFVGH